MIRDLRLAARRLLRERGFAALAVAILAVGLGVTTTIFSLLNTLLLRPPPYPEADRLVRVYRTAGKEKAFAHSAPSLREQREQNTVFDGMAGFFWRNFSLAEPDGAPERLQGMYVTGDYFSTLKVRPQLGRLFLSEEDQPGRNQVVVLSAELWHGRFGGDPGVVGRRLRLDGESVTVVGVMPPSFSHVVLWGPVDLWRPAGLPPARSADRNDYSLHVFGRLKPGVTLPQAQAHMSTVAARLDRQHQTGSGLRLIPLHQSTVGDAGARISWLTMGLAMFVILIVCINLAGVQMARLAGRGHEHAVRLALGASRARLVRQLLTESLLLSLVGGLFGVLLAQWLSGLLGSLIFVGTRVGLELPLDGRVLGFAGALVLLTTLTVGTVPAWLSSRAPVSDGLRRGARGSTDRSQPRLRQGLVVAQMALALVLLTAGGLLVRGLQRYAASDPGWRVDGLLTARLTLPAAKYAHQERRAFFERLQTEMASLPGIERSAISWSLPISGYGSIYPLVVEGRPPPLPGQEVLRFLAGVTPDYFRTLQVPLREGRTFTTADAADATPVAIVNEAMARRLWPGQSALGKRIGNAHGDPEWRTIVGVVGDVRFPANPSEPITRNQVYHPLAQGAQRTDELISLRGHSDPAAMLSGLRRAVARLDPELPLYEIRSARQAVSDQLANFQLVVWILFGFSMLGLVLAALGVYGLFSGFVVQRTREIGVRVALGAATGQVLGLVLRKGLRLALVGAVLGVGAALLLLPVLTSVAAELPAHEPTTVALLALALVAVALFACWLPARRAAALDPMVALRAE